MSETEHEEQDAPVTDPEEPVAPETPEPDEEEHEEEEAAQEPAEEPAAAEPEGMSEKQMEASRKKLDAENTRHANRISEIIGEEAQLLEPCPLCSGFADGYMFPVIPPEDVVTATLSAIGFGDVRDLEPASDAKQCHECKGKGRTKTGALLGDFASKQCATCKGIGYVKMDGSPWLDGAAPQGAGDVVTAPNGSDPDLGPLLEAVRAKGYSVFPPLSVPAS